MSAIYIYLDYITNTYETNSIYLTNRVSFSSSIDITSYWKLSSKLIWLNWYEFWEIILLFYILLLDRMEVLFFSTTSPVDGIYKDELLYNYIYILFILIC